MAFDRGAGQLNKRVAFDSRAQASDGMGNIEGDFVEIFETRAAFRSLRGTDSVIASRLEGQLPTLVRVRSDSRTRGINTDWRMRDLNNGEWAGESGAEYWTGPIYAVRTVSEVDDGRFFLDVLVVKGGVA